MDKKRKEDLLVIRVTKEQKEKIKELASSEMRTMSNYILSKILKR